MSENYSGTSRIPTDVASGGLISIPFEHHETHEGNSYTAFYTRVTAATNGHRSAIMFTTGAKYCHLVATFAASAAANFTIAEAITIASNVGTHTSVPYNRNRNSANTSTILNNATSPAANKYTTLDETQIAADGTFATGTVLRSGPVLAGSGPFAPGGVERGTQEYVLIPDTKYLIMLANTTATATVHYLYGDWYEVG